MVPRLADNPELILAIVRSQLISTTPSQEAIRSRQDETRAAALDQIKRRIGWRLDRCSSLHGVTGDWAGSLPCVKPIGTT